MEIDFERHNQSSFRVCGECSMKNQNSISGVFTNTFFKCKICKNPFLDGCYMLFDNSNEHLTNKPMCYLANRRQGKTTWLVGKMDEYETVNTLNGIFLVVVPSVNYVTRMTKQIEEVTGLQRGIHFKYVIGHNSDRVHEALVELDGTSNVYVDDMHLYSDPVINEIAIATASYRIKQLFYTKTIKAIDILMNGSHIFRAKELNDNGET